MTQYHPPDTSDKDKDETWSEYWDRKRIAIHGTPCKHNCILCVYDIPPLGTKEAIAWLANPKRWEGK